MHRLSLSLSLKEILSHSDSQILSLLQQLLQIKMSLMPEPAEMCQVSRYTSSLGKTNLFLSATLFFPSCTNTLALKQTLLESGLHQAWICELVTAMDLWAYHCLGWRLKSKETFQRKYPCFGSHRCSQKAVQEGCPLLALRDFLHHPLFWPIWSLMGWIAALDVPGGLQYHNLSESVFWLICACFR